MIQNTPQAAAAKADTKLVLKSTAVDEQRRRLARMERGIRRQTGGAVHELKVEVQGETLLLRGHCSSFYCKQKAQHAAMGYLTGETLVNEIEVDSLPR